MFCYGYKASIFFCQIIIWSLLNNNVPEGRSVNRVWKSWSKSNDKEIPFGDICFNHRITNNMWKKWQNWPSNYFSSFFWNFRDGRKETHKPFFVLCGLTLAIMAKSVDDSAFLSCCANLEITSYTWTMHFEEDVKRVGWSLPDRLTGCLTLTEHSNMM